MQNDPLIHFSPNAVDAFRSLCGTIYFCAKPLLNQLFPNLDLPDNLPNFE